MTSGSPSESAASRHRLGARLRQLRQDRAMRLEDAAAELGIVPSTLSRIETGKAPTRAGYVRILGDSRTVTVAFHLLACRLWDAWWDNTPPERTVAERRAAARAHN